MIVVMVFEKYKQKLLRLALVAAMSFVLSLMLFSPAHAAEYNCGAYGAGAYAEGAVCADSEVADTGQNAWTFVIPALAILAGTAMLYRLSRKRKKPVSQE